jgi:hypothetical protein
MFSIGIGSERKEIQDILTENCILSLHVKPSRSIREGHLYVYIYRYWEDMIIRPFSKKEQREDVED